MSPRSIWTVVLAIVLLLPGCGRDIGVHSLNQDFDQDGFDNAADGGDDCNDSNPEINPDAEEICDGIDNDCDGLIDCDDPDAMDADADGVCVCEDCDDGNELTFPGNTEVCDGVDNDCDGLADCADPAVEDADLDGSCTCSDCDDADANNFPGNVEVCDGADNDCDTVVDNNVLFIDWFDDLDSDGHGDPATVSTVCDGPPDVGWVRAGDDCDDADPENYPLNSELCDQRDNDCDTLADEGLSFADIYFDGDHDGYGDPNTSASGCEHPVGVDWVLRAGDCDDANPAINPGAAEVCLPANVDDDCDTFIDCDDPEVLDADADGECVCEDCDDNAGWNYHGNTEICDGLDNNCDGDADCDDASVADGDTDGTCVCEDCDDTEPTVYPGAPEIDDNLDNDCDGLSDCDDDDVPDSDGDGWCAFFDCDDNDASNFPNNRELCDGLDNDCDAVADNGLPFLDWFDDTDGDQHGDPATRSSTCDGAPGTTWVLLGDDCDDNDILNFPNNNEICDGRDNDCDANGEADEGLSVDKFYPDLDGDGFGDPSDERSGCTGPPMGAWVTVAGDCDDTNANIHPAAAEACLPANVDDDCDGLIDCDDPEVQNADGDIECICEDCNDLQGWNFHGNTEICDGMDNNCDGLVDCADSTVPDADNDGYCECPSSDCDDSDPTVYVGAPELHDNLDNDCDQLTDCSDPDVPDDDTDGFCVFFDCDDNDSTAFPGASEVCDGVDNDCDGTIPASESTDGDSDGWRLCEDCDDGSADSYPGAPELCDGEDNNCDTVIPANEVDADVDGAIACLDCDDDDPTVKAITPDLDGDTYDECSRDCDETNAAINPGAPEVCDYLDNDCDAVVDEGFLSFGRYEQFDNCGFCGNDCGTMTFANAVPQCDIVLDPPDCRPNCWPDFYDANNDGSDGCECHYNSAFDLPFDGIDDDCNGDDGDPNDAVHVALWGLASGAGTLADPVRDVQAGIDLAVSQGSSYVLVSQGVYYESVRLDPTVSLIGGYSFFFEQLDASFFETVLDGRTTTAARPGTINLTCTGPLEQRITGFKVIGTLPDDSGESSYGLHLTDCDDTLTLVNNTVLARPGADGDDGDFGDNGEQGLGGGDGLDSALTLCSPNPVGGSGGLRSCAAPSAVDDVFGGDGGGAECPIVANGFAGDGTPGLGTVPGGGGGGGSYALFASIPPDNSCSTAYVGAGFGPGGVGGVGDPGGHGTGGSGCATPQGQIVGGLFVPDRGDQGIIGDNGSGGGGGGAGSGAEVRSTCGSAEVHGGMGGGGGSGGCGAEGGLPGQGAGGSFGLFLVYTAPAASYPVLDTNLIEADFGGEGGWGGSGGIGGDGGIGGVGGAQGASGVDFVWAGRTGGNGGNGGSGGHGGGGGGGCGGPSYALFVNGATPAASYGAGSTLNFQGGGLGGRGGYSPGDIDGGMGTSGAQGARNF